MGIQSISTRREGSSWRGGQSEWDDKVAQSTASGVVESVQVPLGQSVGAQCEIVIYLVELVDG